MSKEQKKSAPNLSWRYPEVLERPSVLHSYETEWKNIVFHQEHQSAGETPTLCSEQYMIGILATSVGRVDSVLDGRFQSKIVFDGAIMLCPMSCSHSFRWYQELDAIGLALMPDLLTSHASELFGVESIEFIPKFALYDPLIYQIALALKADLESGKPGSQLYAEHIANALAVHLLRKYSNQSDCSIQTFDGLSARQLSQVVDYINDYLDRDLSLKELAALAQLSQYHFSRAFKRSTGLSPHQYVLQRRVERAKQLLRQNEMKLCEIAIACGFAHQSHLNRHFKRLTGITPKTFLKS